MSSSPPYVGAPRPLAGMARAGAIHARRQPHDASVGKLERLADLGASFSGARISCNRAVLELHYGSGHCPYKR